MMDTPSRKIQSRLENILPGVPVYFRPPTGFKLSFPCVVFDIRDGEPLFGDNRPYAVWHKYRVSYFTRDPEDPNIYAIEQMPNTVLADTAQESGINRFIYNTTDM